MRECIWDHDSRCGSLFAKQTYLSFRRGLYTLRCRSLSTKSSRVIWVRLFSQWSSPSFRHGTLLHMSRQSFSVMSPRWIRDVSLFPQLRPRHSCSAVSVCFRRRDMYTTNSGSHKYYELWACKFLQEGALCNTSRVSVSSKDSIQCEV